VFFFLSETVSYKLRIPILSIRPKVSVEFACTVVIISPLPGLPVVPKSGESALHYA
jgi:hypothetical protein